MERQEVLDGAEEETWRTLGSTETVISVRSHVIGNNQPCFLASSGVATLGHPLQ